LTGASAGIGLALLEALDGEAFVFAVSRTQPPAQRQGFKWIPGDLREPEAVSSEILERLRTEGRALEGIIHCAASYGADGRHPFIDTTDSEWDDVMTVNVRSQFILTTRLLPLLLERPRAFIVALSSDVATQPAPGRIAYGCSKAASHALFAGLAAELSASHVSVIEMRPQGQVITRGIRRRRPLDFDFCGYSDPEIFTAPIRSIVRSRGEGWNGEMIIVA
jgi:short-subunit dehydrogenase